MNIYNILEVANTHAGSLDYISALIAEFKGCSEDKLGIKFQPFSSDCIALPDFEWYPVYKILEFNSDEWQKIIDLASDNFDVWLDMFDDYSTRILLENLDTVKGIKLQASTLKNFSLMSKLKKIDLQDKIVIANIAGYDAINSEKVLNYLKNELNPKELIVQIGFQDYPTAFVDSGLHKIPAVKEFFSGTICFADHTDGLSDEAVLLPMLAVSSGCAYIEKHIMHSSLETKYDAFSSVKVEVIKNILCKQKQLIGALAADYIVENEKAYLKKSYQFPVAKMSLQKGRCVDLLGDLDFKRTSKPGLRVDELEELLVNRHLLAVGVEPNEVLKAEHFKRANIAVVVACRTKSSRLKKKATLNIGGLPSVERCLKSCMKIADVNHLILATSTHPDDAVLEQYTYNDSVLFRKGSEDDVIQRYLDIADELRLDVIIRVTADMPYVSDEIAALLLDSHFNSGADYTCATGAAVGTACEIYNVSALRKVKEKVPNTDYSEYMTFYITNNSDYFKINKVDLPSCLVRDYRLTLDYQEDLDLFNKIQQYLEEQKQEVILANIYKYLDENIEVSKINSEMNLVYRDDGDLIEKLNKATTFPPFS
jgi:N,N'-diacetyllegionaminate synthase